MTIEPEQRITIAFNILEILIKKCESKQSQYFENETSARSEALAKLAFKMADDFIVASEI